MACYIHSFIRGERFRLILFEMFAWVHFKYTKFVFYHFFPISLYLFVLMKIKPVKSVATLCNLAQTECRFDCSIRIWIRFSRFFIICNFRCLRIEIKIQDENVHIDVHSMERV